MITSASESTSSLSLESSLRADLLTRRFLCRTFAQWPNVNTLLLATVVRTGLVIVSYGCKVPAGIFVPSMAIGATFGRMIGIISKAMHAFVPFSLSPFPPFLRRLRLIFFLLTVPIPSQDGSELVNLISLASLLEPTLSSELLLLFGELSSLFSPSSRDWADFRFFSTISGVTRMTVTVVVIMFELTGALTYVLPTMVSRRLVLYSFPNPN